MPEILLEQVQPPSDQAPPEGPPSEPEKKRSVVGIIYPPPEVRNIVDKTADFVARNGPEFENRIKLNEAGNNKFNFLNIGDPYHAYYKHKIKEIQEGVAQEALQQQQPSTQIKAQIPAAIVTELEVPKEPPPEWEFMAEPPTISRRHLDIVRLTAQFVARNGPQFMDQLMAREQKNETFDFLRKNHILFSFFIKLVEQYSKVLMPSHSMTQKLVETVENPHGVLERVRKRVVWQQYQDKEKQKIAEKAEKERVEYAQIDWHDFVIVETINFRGDEGGFLPPPIQPSQLAARLLQQQKYERMDDQQGEVEDVEMEVEEAEMEDTQPPLPPEEPKPAEPHQLPSVSSFAISTSNAPIVKDYNPKASGPPPAPVNVAAQQYLISPITGEKVPADKLQDHMRHALLDPRWIEEQKRQVEQKQQEEEAIAEGQQIASNIKKLATRRTDIFGTEETVIGQKIGEEKPPRPNPVQWDGHTASAEATRQAANAKISAKEQLEHIQRMKGILSDPTLEKIGPKVTKASTMTSLPPINPAPPPIPVSKPAPPPPEPLLPPKPAAPPAQVPPQSFQMPRPLLPTPGPGFIPVPHPGMVPHGMMRPGFIHPAPNVEPPSAKKPKSDADNLIPEHEFIAKYPGPVTFFVQVPDMPDRPEWNLKGQKIPITLPITDPVSVVKAKIADEIAMPTGKQKLQIGNLFIKDSNSLGFYNFMSSTVVLLGLKERGGKKK